MTKTIPLTRGLTALVDDADFTWLNQWKWSTQRPQSRWPYAVRTDHSQTGRKGGRSAKVFMHRLICGVSGEDMVDHRNGDTLDNRRSNLRIATNSQNQQNRRLVAGKHPYKGIQYNRESGKWQTQITVDGTRKYIGMFSTAEQAARGYDAAAREYFGEFAAVNFAADTSKPHPTRDDQSSRYRGVYWSIKQRLWRACIWDAGKAHSLGAFASERDAAKAYDYYEHEKHGKAARYNFPEEPLCLPDNLHRRELLDDWQVRAMRRAREEVGFSFAHLGRQFGLDGSTVKRICDREAYRHVR